MALEEYRKKVANLSVNEQKFRDLYLRDLALGKIEGPPTGYASLDKPWLKYYSEKQIMAEMPKETMYHYMMKNNMNHLDDIALLYFGNKITYKELQTQIEKCAKSLIARGIRPDDKVTLCMPNTPEAVIMVYALNRIGAVANMVHPLSSQNEIRNFINEVNSKIVMTIDSSASKVSNIINETNAEDVIVVSPSDSMKFPLKQLYNCTNKVKLDKDDRFISWNKFLSFGDKVKEVKDYEYQENHVAVLLHTGGTTGTPKAVELTNDNFNSMVEQFFLSADNFNRGDKMLTVMPVFHGFGLCSSLHLPLSRGVAAILIPKIDIQNVDKLLNKYKPNHILGVPTLFKGIKSVIEKKMESGKLKDFDLSYLKYAVSGGDTVLSNFEEEINSFFLKHGSKAKLAKGYGFTEAVAGVTFAYDDYNNVSSVGIPMVQTNMKIVKSNTDEEVLIGEPGEICVKGPTVMRGYYNNPEETKQTIVDSWVHTGDVGTFNKDGILYFNQRKGEMIISSGVNVYPKEVETIIESNPAVAACAVIGIYHPYKGEVPKAYIALKEGYEYSKELENEIIDACKKNLNRYSIPASYEFREQLPQTLLGKICRNELREEEKAKIMQKKL